MPSAYAGNPSNYPASVNILSGGDAPNTANFNTAYEGTLDRTAFLRARTANAVQNWYPSILPASFPANSSDNAGTVVYGAAWNPKTAQWLVLTSNDNASGNNKRVSAYLTYGEDPASAGIPNGHFGTSAVAQDGSVVVDPNNTSGFLAALTYTSGSSLVFKCVGTTWTQVHTFSSDGSVAMCSFGGYGIFFTVGITVPANGDVIISSTADSGSTWSTYTYTLSLSASYVSAVEIKASASLVIAVPISYSGSSGLNDYFTSPDGVTWTHRTFSFLGSHDLIVGISWQPLAAVWVVAVQTSVLSGTTTAFYSSPDGVTWNLITAGPAVTLSDIESVGPVLVCALQQPANATPCNIMSSEDVGATWYLNQGTLPGMASTGTSNPAVVTNGNQIFAFNANNLRFSNVAGLPASHL